VSLALLLLALFAPAPGFDRVEIGRSTDQRVRLLRHPNPAVRQRAAQLLGHASGDRALAGLLVALSDRSALVRAASAEALLRIGDERSVPFLARRLREEFTPAVLEPLLLALARCGGGYAARQIAPFLDHPVRDVRAAAATALGRVGDPGQRGALWALLRYGTDDPGMRIRSAVLGAFVELGWREEAVAAIAELEAAGAHRHWFARVSIVSAVGLLRLPEREGWLRDLFLADEDPRVVAAAASALGRLGFREDLLAALDHPGPDVRRAAIVGLEEARDPRAAGRARQLLSKDPDPAVRFEAALVLHHLKAPDSDLYLVDALRSDNALYWLTALAALEEKHPRSFGRDPDAWAAYLRRTG